MNFYFGAQRFKTSEKISRKMWADFFASRSDGTRISRNRSPAKWTYSLKSADLQSNKLVFWILSQQREQQWNCCFCFLSQLALENSRKVCEALILSINCVIRELLGYLCYECNSTIDVNCFDFSPTFSYYKAVECDPEEKGAENCVAFHISGEREFMIFQDQVRG